MMKHFKKKLLKSINLFGGILVLKTTIVADITTHNEPIIIN